MFSFEHVLVHLIEKNRYIKKSDFLLIIYKPAWNEVDTILPLTEVCLDRQRHDPGWLLQQGFLNFFLIIILNKWNRIISQWLQGSFLVLNRTDARVCLSYL